MEYRDLGLVIGVKRWLPWYASAKVFLAISSDHEYRHPIDPDRPHFHERLESASTFSGGGNRAMAGFLDKRYHAFPVQGDLEVDKAHRS